MALVMEKTFFFALLFNLTLYATISSAQSKYSTDSESNFAMKEVNHEYFYEHVKEWGQERVIEDLQKRMAK